MWNKRRSWGKSRDDFRPARVPPITGRQHDRPMWRPLQQLIGEKLCSCFMYMGCTEAGMMRLYLYKHVNTRRYLNLSADGRTWTYDPPRYYECEPRDAIDWVNGVLSKLPEPKGAKQA